MQPLISVIVPIYNVAQYLHQCINSIINQTYKNLEIILVDDGSTDESGKICDEYAQKDNRIIVIHQNNKGLVGARKAGVYIANGDYIGHVDGDDWIEPKMYEHLLNIILETDADFVDSGYRRGENKIPERKLLSYIKVDDTNREKIIYDFLIRKSVYYSEICSSLWSKLIKKSLMFNSQYFVSNEVCNGEDRLCILYMIQFSNKIAFTDKYYYNYRKRENSITTQNNLGNIIKSLIIYMHNCYMFFNKYNYSIEYYKLINKEIIMDICYCCDRNIEDISSKYRYNVYKYLHDNIISTKNIVLYGAGDVGISYYNYHKNDMNIVCWADKNYQHLTDYPVKIESPDNILNYNFDYLLIAVKSENLANLIKQDLIFKGIPEEKILWSKPESTLDWLL